MLYNRMDNRTLALVREKSIFMNGNENPYHTSSNTGWLEVVSETGAKGIA